MIYRTSIAMKLIILSILFCGALAGNYGGYGRQYGHGYGPRPYGGIYQKVSSHYGNTKFAYNDGLSTREEHIAYDGSRYGSYSVKGADGELRTVKYKAGKDGFQIVGDDGSVKEDNVARAAALAEKATELAKLAPEAPEVPEVPEVPEAELKVAPTNAPDYGKRNEEVYEARKNYYGNKHHGYGGYGNGGYAHGGYGGYGYTKSYSHQKVAYPAGYGGYANKGYGYGGYGYGKCYNHEEGVWEACKEKKDEPGYGGYGHGYGIGNRYAARPYAGNGKCYDHEKGVWEACKEKKDGYGYVAPAASYGYGGYARGYGHAAHGNTHAARSYAGHGYGKCYNHEKGVWEACKEKKDGYGYVAPAASYGYGGYAHGTGHAARSYAGHGYGKCYNHEKGVWEACKEKKVGYGYAAPAASYGYGYAVAHTPAYKPAYKW